MVLLLSYLTGVISTILVLCIGLGYKIGFANLHRKLRLTLMPSENDVLSMPKDLIQDLIRVEGVVGSVLNPTKRDRHNTALLQSHDEFAFTLRANAELTVSTLRSQRPLNFNPPVLQLRKNHTGLSARIEEFLQRQSRLSYSYSTDENGLRRTVPLIPSDKRILIMGASVPFGVGVDDESTIASHLQQLIGQEYQVINSSVCGYNALQSLLRTQQLSSTSKFNGLIFVASQHDFMYSEVMRRFSREPRPLAKDWVGDAEKIFRDLKSISDRFDSRVCILLHTYIEYDLYDIFLEKGWRNGMIEKTRELGDALPEIANELGFEYCDWTEIVTKFMSEQKSILSRFALYADHCHASPLGNQLMAESIYNIIKHKWLVMKDPSDQITHVQ